MTIAEKEHKKRNKRVARQEKVPSKTPEWFDKEIQKDTSIEENNQLEELLKEYKS